MENTNLKFKRILVAVDDAPCSEKAILYARELAQVFRASVALVTVIPPTSPTNFGADPLLGQQPIIVPEVSEMEQENAQKYLEKLSREFVGSEEVYLFNRIGSVKEEILTASHEWSADLIIMGSNGRSGFDHFISGSVSESVIRKATCPVLVIPSKCD
ncbi:universal stress protein [Sphingobacterium sp. NGMCC 1.201703]|uniref:universal stress protein n=1 Tax=Sphingobacterium sp. NGMCC 1.201703 TaxID=3388657 RepID=UPI0039FB9575